MAATVLVLGGGFAGLAAAGRLARLGGRAGLSVRLLSRGPDSVFSPLLPDLISGRLRPEHVCHPIGPHCRRLGVEFVQAEVRQVRADPPRAVTDRGELRADYLILCLGCETNYFGDDQMAARTLGLKSVGEACAIAGRAVEAVERSRRGGPAASFIVVGGGYTGFEVASHLALRLHRCARLPYDRLGQVARILIVEKAEEPLGNVSSPTRRWARRLLARWSVELRTGTALAETTPEGRARLSDATAFDHATVIWTAGVRAGPAVDSLDAPRTRGGRLEVDECLRVAGTERVFAAGDLAGAAPAGDGQPLRMSVQFSLLGGRAAADNVVRSILGQPLKPFRPRDPGYLVPLGPGRAAGVILGVPIKGRTPLALHYAMCIFRSWGWRSRWDLLRSLLRPG